MNLFWRKKMCELTFFQPKFLSNNTIWKRTKNNKTTPLLQCKIFRQKQNTKEFWSKFKRLHLLEVLQNQNLPDFWCVIHENWNCESSNVIQSEIFLVFQKAIKISSKHNRMNSRKFKHILQIWKRLFINSMTFFFYNGFYE